MNVCEERGIAVIVALMTMVLLMALGTALVLVTNSETMIAANFRAANEAIYAADAGLERVLADLGAASDWESLLAGDVRSSFVDGPPSGKRTLADGSTIDLAGVANMANCQKTVACTDPELNAKTSERPWGANNPRWSLYAYGRLADSARTGSLISPYYLVALISDDPSRNSDVLLVRAEAFGPRSGHRVVQASVARAEALTAGLGATPKAPRVLAWTEVP